MSNRRFTRLTNGFSKKVENHAAQIAIFMVVYNFQRKHMTLGTTPAVKAGIAMGLVSRIYLPDAPIRDLSCTRTGFRKSVRRVFDSRTLRFPQQLETAARIPPGADLILNGSPPLLRHLYNIEEEEDVKFVG